MNTETSKLSQQTNNKNIRKTFLIIISIIIVFICQMQPVFVRIIGGVAGSFGIRPTSHLCIGFPLDGDILKSLFPTGEFEFRAGLFHFRYSVTQGDHDPAREYCLGQDIWFGE